MLTLEDSIWQVGPNVGLQVAGLSELPLASDEWAMQESFMIFLKEDNIRKSYNNFRGTKPSFADNLISGEVAGHIF